MNKLKKITFICLALVMIAGFSSVITIAADIFDGFYGGYKIIENQTQPMARVPGGVMMTSSNGNSVGWWWSGSDSNHVFSNLRSNWGDNPNVDMIRTSAQNGNGEINRSDWEQVGRVNVTASSSIVSTWSGNRTFWNYIPFPS